LYAVNELRKFQCARIDFDHMASHVQNSKTM